MIMRRVVYHNAARSYSLQPDLFVRGRFTQQAGALSLLKHSSPDHTEPDQDDQDGENRQVDP